MSNKGIESVPVEATGAIQGLKSVSTDAGGFAEVGPFVPGESITVKVTPEGFDDVQQVITAAEDVDHMMLGANPTVSLPIQKITLVLPGLSDFLLGT